MIAKDPSSTNETRSFVLLTLINCNSTLVIQDRLTSSPFPNYKLLHYINKFCILFNVLTLFPVPKMNWFSIFPQNVGTLRSQSSGLFYQNYWPLIYLNLSHHLWNTIQKEKVEISFPTASCLHCMTNTSSVPFTNIHGFIHLYPGLNKIWRKWPAVGTLSYSKIGRQLWFFLRHGVSPENC